MKNIFTTLLIIIAAIPCMAQQMLIEKGSSTTAIEFNNLDKITFNDNIVNITQNNGKTLSAAMGEISRISFSNYASINDIEVQPKDFIRYISCDIIAVNSKAGSTVTIYSITGSQISCAHQAADNGTISIASLPKGIYIIKSEDRTAKFIKR